MVKKMLLMLAVGALLVGVLDSTFVHAPVLQTATTCVIGFVVGWKLYFVYRRYRQLRRLPPPPTGKITFP